jgi:NAD(P)-dependent dehydrogenase (short-subunit alcohol dehydrogenase family)
MDLQLRGKKALITGGTRGIGRGIADILAGEGCDIALCARNAQDVDDAVGALQAKGVHAFGAVADVSDPASLTGWIERAVAALGGADLLVFNVSAQSLGRDAGSWRVTFETDLMSTVNGIEAALPALRKSASGAILFINSIMGSEHQVMTGGAYSGIKAAMHSYSKGLAIDLAPEGIRVNTLTPGAVDFEGSTWHRARGAGVHLVDLIMAEQPMGRMGTPEEIGNAAAFLLSPLASFVSGANLVVDGASTRRVHF